MNKAEQLEMLNNVMKWNLLQARGVAHDRDQKEQHEHYISNAREVLQQILKLEKQDDGD